MSVSWDSIVAIYFFFSHRQAVEIGELILAAGDGALSGENIPIAALARACALRHVGLVRTMVERGAVAAVLATPNAFNNSDPLLNQRM